MKPDACEASPLRPRERDRPFLVTCVMVLLTVSMSPFRLLPLAFAMPAAYPEKPLRTGVS
jgi:hypothetical protein